MLLRMRVRVKAEDWQLSTTHNETMRRMYTGCAAPKSVIFALFYHFKLHVPSLVLSLFAWSIEG